MENRKQEPVLKKDNELTFPHAVLINASAGTGKTYTLTHRYVQFLLSDHIRDADGNTTNNISNILAITFTRKAAKEMKTRIIQLLTDTALGKAPRDSVDGMLRLLSLTKQSLREKAAKQVNYILDNYSDFHIQTIDKFMARVMRCSADELGLRPDQEISTDYAMLVDAALYAVFSRLDAGVKAQIDNFLRNMPATGTYKWNPIHDMKGLFEDFLMQENKLYGGFHLLPDNERKAQTKKLFQEILDLSKSLTAIVPDHVDDATKNIIERDVKDDGLDRHIQEYISHLKKHGILHRIKRNKQGELPIPDEAIQIKSELDVRLGALIESLSASYFNAYITLYDTFKSQLKQVERSKSTGMHIQQISKILSEYLGSDHTPDVFQVPEIYLKLGDILYHFLIDEFQDTDKIQWRNLRALIEESLSRGGSLFMVGDLKQAIYMFRNADYGIMKDLLSAGESGHSKYLSLDALPGGLEVKDLTVNRRSNAYILDYVKEVFQTKLKEYLAGKSLEDVTGLTSFPQEAEDKKKNKGIAAVKTVLYDLPDEKDACAKQPLLEILQGIEGAEGIINRFRYKDIMILVQKNKHIKSVASWLNEAGIPVVSSSSLDIRTRPLIAEIIALLRFLDSPVDDLSFAEFINGKIFTAQNVRETGGTRDAAVLKQEVMEMIHGWRFTGKGYLYTWFQDHANFSSVWKSDFARLFSSVGYKPVYELVSDIYKIFHVFDNFGNETAFLVKFLDTVNALQAEGLHDIKGLLDYARENDAGNTNSERFSVALPEYIDAVNVMTFHGSKGLERPVVINIITDEKNPAESLYVHKNDGNDPNILLYHITAKDAGLSKELETIKDARETTERVQTLNTLYVINTRAKDELYNIVITRRGRESES